MGKYQLFMAENGQFYFNLYATNGRVIGTSETYVHLGGAFNGMESVRKNCLIDERFEVRRDVNNKPYFVLKAANGEIILKSESYTSLGKCNVGINSVMKNGTSDVMDMPKPLADKLVEMQRGDACTQCGSKEIHKYDGKSRAWCEPCLDQAPQRKQKSLKSQKIQRNSKCLCGSGKKFKQCCINKK